MSEVVDESAVTPAENTPSPEEHGTVGSSQAPDSSNPEGGEEKKIDVAALQAQLEDERKARQNAELERNNLRNRQKEAERKRLEETEDYKSAYEQLRADQEEREAREAEERELKEAQSFRDTVIARRSE